TSAAPPNSGAMSRTPSAPRSRPPRRRRRSKRCAAPTRSPRPRPPTRPRTRSAARCGRRWPAGSSTGSPWRPPTRCPSRAARPTRRLPPGAPRGGSPAALPVPLPSPTSLYSEPSGDAAWRSRRLDYAASVTSTALAPGAAAADTVALVASDFHGGEMDWFSFSLAKPAAEEGATTTPPEATVETFNFLPGHVTFRGMPASRWWDFEDGVTDFGALTPEKVDLATLLVME